jgi:hypothetical protein
MPSTTKSRPRPPKIIIPSGGGYGQEVSSKTLQPQQPQQAADKNLPKEQDWIWELWDRWQHQRQLSEEYEERLHGRVDLERGT